MFFKKIVLLKLTQKQSPTKKNYKDNLNQIQQTLHTQLVNFKSEHQRVMRESLFFKLNEIYKDKGKNKCKRVD